MRPTIGVINYSEQTDYKACHEKNVQELDLSHFSAADEGKIIKTVANEISATYVMLPVYIKGKDRMIWLKGFAVESGFFERHQTFFLIER